MASSPLGPRLLRFDRIERCAHWLNALLFGALMLTALPLYFGTIGGFTARRALVAEIHLWCGIALPVPLLISLAGPWGARFRRDLRRINRWTGEEMRWLRTFGAAQIRSADKFNPGQKLNAAFTAGAIVVMLATGSVLKWFRFFPLDWRTGATFVHDLLALGVFIVVTGHVLFALSHPAAMRAMVTGTIPRRWAERHANGWLEEESEKTGAAPPA